MATETSNTIDIYGLTEWNEMVKVASAVLLTLKPVGGTIFYIDDTADGVYQFFDADGNLIETVNVGDKPYAYKVVTSGTKDKYYVYHDEVYDNTRWTYYKDGAYVMESAKSMGLADNMHEITGTGRTNTEIVMTRDNGAYITADSNGLPTIWYRLQQVRDAKIGGCDDWFVPCLHECEKLQRAIKSGSITGGVIAGSSYSTSVFRKNLWSSGVWEYNAECWLSSDEIWYAYSKTEPYSVFFTRAF